MSWPKYQNEVKGGNTANLCAIDMSKAFDKINYHALFVKLMKRHVPIEFLEMLENWLCDSQACVKWMRPGVHHTSSDEVRIDHVSINTE